MAKWQDLTDEQLVALPTSRLYVVYKLMQERRGYDYYDYDTRGNEVEGFEELNRQCAFVKAELDTRGHIERKPIQHEGIVIKQHSPRYDWFNPNPARVDPVGPIKEPDACIGKQVFKRSKKPFKSKQFYNTVKAVTINPHTKRVAFSFEEDSSVVDVHQCNLRENK